MVPHPAPIHVVEVWSHDGKLYEVNSMYSLPDDASDGGGGGGADRGGGVGLYAGYSPARR
jgi:hypothetical protein